MTGLMTTVTNIPTQKKYFVSTVEEPRVGRVMLLAPVEQGYQGSRVEEQLTGHDGETR